ncbi:uncharacterized protein LOC110034026 [Phalaenopsis equestris]|uniref:uncharacterized protein LOC110034026 n=1 Tax=Phalaenopsis equestris TaxID=78828 RepID=UPI0009E264ED|nr:uncharacterized protein LOC110034026 [Phalaenopsis equestris]
MTANGELFITSHGCNFAKKLHRAMSDLSLELDRDAAEGHGDILPVISELIIEDITCECCGISEECTPEYIRRIRDKFSGKWICGLCSDAVEEEKRKKKKMEGKQEEAEALDSHMSSCSRFNRIERTHPVFYQAEAMREILRKRKKKGGILRTSSCIPVIREEGGGGRGGFR